MKDTKLEGKERREGDSEEGMSSLRTRAMDDCDSTDGGTGNHTQPLNHFFSPLFHCLDILLLFSFVWFFFFLFLVFETGSYYTVLAGLELR